MHKGLNWYPVIIPIPQLVKPIVSLAVIGLLTNQWDGLLLSNLAQIQTGSHNIFLKILITKAKWVLWKN